MAAVGHLSVVQRLGLQQVAVLLLQFHTYCYSKSAKSKLCIKNSRETSTTFVEVRNREHVRGHQHHVLQVYPQHGPCDKEGECPAVLTKDQGPQQSGQPAVLVQDHVPPLSDHGG